jgi:N utilization substance protein A
MPQSEQVEEEVYRVNQRLKVYVKDVRSGQRGTEIIVSRADAQFVVKLFEQEVPEISNGTVEIKAIAREPGSRTKMAVLSNDEKIDPVGSCVGQKGVRVQSIISELFGEKIDIIPYSGQIEKFIAASLSPARVTEVVIDEKENKATVSVPEDQQSLAIGKEGQNARLANKLTKWKIDIKGAKGIFDIDGDSKNKEKGSSSVVGVWDAAIEAVNKQEAEEEVVVVDTPVEVEEVLEEIVEETKVDDQAEETVSENKDD